MIEFKDFLRLRDFLYRKTGIYMDDKKYEQFSKKLISYLKEHSYDNFSVFFHALRFESGSNMLQGVINLVTVNETYFFREKHHFDILINNVLPFLHQHRSKNDILRILCAPSSTGEEPYTLALHLLDEAKLLESRDIELIGIDIDSNAIDKATSGVFTKRSVQFVPNHLLTRYFKYKENNYHIHSHIKSSISFKVANVMDRNQMMGLGNFDVIFSRNMLIYFDDESRKNVSHTFHDLLKPKGFVFLGHADKMCQVDSLFDTVKMSDSIIYQKSNK
ncbi:CheR family methyltransferase [Arcobacter sp. FWKO B]|uniref:CheR family methyltransferase n=1 Tax=Arcobacter sp. FWKO B TaxID=2593672 RepID=UPI0018A38966|nr:protein-glutamate O-methyltransferase CheR [Arcobacter sp. FWKO B]QOG11208.1 protein-glutamate O-methyltransferase CheR [Arcobacter sp. FWKO B]